MIDTLFAAIDARDAQRFADHLSEDCRFRFGNAPAVAGKDAVQAYVAGFFDSIRGIEHHIEDCWETADAMVCHGTVNYTRHDETQLKVPFANVLKLDGGKVRDYLIFLDNSALYAQ